VQRVQTQRIVIELDRNAGPISGTFVAQDTPKVTPFYGWIELLALLETARDPSASAPDDKERAR
jgi:hypothetical protein